jgi:hypothetical protein
MPHRTGWFPTKRRERGGGVRKMRREICANCSFGSLANTAGYVRRLDISNGGIRNAKQCETAKGDFL